MFDGRNGDRARHVRQGFATAWRDVRDRAGGHDRPARVGGSATRRTRSSRMNAPWPLFVVLARVGAHRVRLRSGAPHSAGSRARPARSLFGLVVPALAAFAVYRTLLPVRSATGSAFALRAESFRRFLKASEGRHVEWAWKQGLLREYSAWAVALGAADAWERAMQASSVAPAELSTRPAAHLQHGPVVGDARTPPRPARAVAAASAAAGRRLRRRRLLRWQRRRRRRRRQLRLLVATIRVFRATRVFGVDTSLHETLGCTAPDRISDHDGVATASVDPVRCLIAPLREFLHTEIRRRCRPRRCAALVALVWANSPWQDAYQELWHTRARASASATADARPRPARVGQRRADGDLLLRRRAGDQARARRGRAARAVGGRRCRPSRPSAGWSCRPLIYLAVNAGGDGVRRLGHPDGDRHRVRRRRPRPARQPRAPVAEAVPARPRDRRRHRRDRRHRHLLLRAHRRPTRC